MKWSEALADPSPLREGSQKSCPLSFWESRVVSYTRRKTYQSDFLVSTITTLREPQRRSQEPTLFFSCMKPPCLSFWERARVRANLTIHIWIQQRPACLLFDTTIFSWVYLYFYSQGGLTESLQPMPTPPKLLN